MNSSSIKVSLIIPVFNEALIIEDYLSRIPMSKTRYVSIIYNMTTQFLATLQGELVDLGTLIQNKTIHTIEMPATDPALQRYSANFNGRVTIGTNDLSVEMNGVALNGIQRYTFGPTQPSLWEAVSNTGSTLIFSLNGTFTLLDVI